MDKVILLYAFFGILTCYGKPTHPGPCVGPDCYHGQLMHGDKEAGIDHKAEDNYLRFKDELAAGKAEPKPDTPEQLGVGKMEVDIGVQGKEDVKKGPIQPIDAEAVLNDGKEKPQSKEAKPQTDEVPKTGSILPVDAEVMMHGGDTKPHDHEAKAAVETVDEAAKKGPILPVDAEFIMHGGDQKPHTHDDKVNENKDQKEEGNKGPILPIDAESLMHGDGEHLPHAHAEKKEKEEEGKKLGPGGEDYWHGVLNHGDKELGNDHHGHEKKSEPNKYDFNIEDIKNIEGIGAMLAKVDLNAMLKQNNDDYKQWVKGGRRPEGDESIWEQLEQVRQRYLSFGGAKKEESEEERAQRLNPLTSEWETDPSLNSKTGKEDDIVHDLETFGNVAPLNSVLKNHRTKTVNNEHVTHDES